ncbi:uncharacterized protein LOC100374443 isoform X1 [Saccoglossus kowalevskii]
MTKLTALLVFLTVSYTAHGLSVTTQALHEGLEEESITLECSYTAPADGGSQYVITWDFTPEWGSETETILVKEGTGSETSYGQFSGRASISGSQGDLRITRLEVEDTGTFTCDVDYYVVKDEGSATTQLEVYKVVYDVDIFGYYTGDYVYVEHGEPTDMKCEARSGRPQAELIWYLDNREIEGGTEEFEDNRDGTFDTVSTLRYTFKEEDHNKVLKCESSQKPEIEYLSEYDHIIINTAGASAITISMSVLLAGIFVLFLQKF